METLVELSFFNRRETTETTRNLRDGDDLLWMHVLDGGRNCEKTSSAGSKRRSVSPKQSRTSTHARRGGRLGLAAVTRGHLLPDCCCAYYAWTRAFSLGRFPAGHFEYARIRRLNLVGAPISSATPLSSSPPAPPPSPAFFTYPRRINDNNNARGVRSDGH